MTSMQVNLAGMQGDYTAAKQLNNRHRKKTLTGILEADWKKIHILGLNNSLGLEISAKNRPLEKPQSKFGKSIDMVNKRTKMET